MSLPPLTPETSPLPPGVRLVSLNDAPPDARAILFPYHMGRQWRACLGTLGFAAVSGWMATTADPASDSLPLDLDPRWVGGFGVLFFLGLAVWSFRANLRPRFLALASEGVVLSRTGGGDLLPWGAIELVTVEQVPGPGGMQTVLAFRFREEDQSRFLPRLRKEMEWNRQVSGPDLVLPVQLFAAPPELILTTLAHYLQHPAEREQLGPSGLPRVVVYTPGGPGGRSTWTEAGRDPSPFAHGPRLEAFRQQLLRGEAELTPERLLEVLADLEPDPRFSPPELDHFENRAAPWMEVSRPEWLTLTRDLLLRPDLEPHLYDQAWLFCAELGERDPEALVRTFAPLLAGPATEAGERGHLLAIQFLGESGREEAVDHLAPLATCSLADAELEALALALATLCFPRSRALLTQLQDTTEWKVRPRPELVERLQSILSWTPPASSEGLG